VYIKFACFNFSLTKALCQYAKSTAFAVLLFFKAILLPYNNASISKATSLSVPGLSGDFIPHASTSCGNGKVPA